MAPATGLPASVVARLGVVPSYYLHYFWEHDNVVAYEQLHPSRAEEVMEVERRLLGIYQDETVSSKPELLSRRGGAFYSEAAVELMASLFGHQTGRHVVNMRNRGALPFLDDAAVVEVPAQVDSGQVSAVPVPGLGPLYRGLISHVSAYEELALDAALQGGQERVYRALLAHPLIGQTDLAETLVAEDIEGLYHAFDAQLAAKKLVVDNDTFALLHAGMRGADTVAVVCGAGINVVGQDQAGNVVRYPSLGWETGDWGGADMFCREALFMAARARDERGQPTVVPDLVESHFGLSLEEVAVAVHFRRIGSPRLGELAPALAAAAQHDAVAASLIDRLAGEVSLLAWRALRDLKALGHAADVVLGGGMLGPGPLLMGTRAKLAGLAPQARPVVGVGAPVAGSVARALEMAGAPPAARERFRARFALVGEPGTVA